MSIKEKAEQVCSAIVETTSATSDQVKEIREQIFSLYTEVETEFLRVAGNHLERKIVEVFEGEL
jgi:hypothetical protein